MTRLTIRRGGTKRVRATFFADQGAGIARDLSGLTLLVIDQSPNIAPPALAILPPATGGQIEVLWTDEQTAPLKSGAGRVRKLRGVTFSRRDTGNRGIGLIAQELAPIVPEAVMTHEDGLLSVAYGNLVGVLIEAVKDLADKVERLEAQA